MINNLPTSLISSASKILAESKPPIIGRLKTMIDSGRYEILSHAEDHNYHSYDVNAVAPDNALPFKHRERAATGWYDPEISELHTPHPEDQFPRTYPRIKSNEWHDRIPEQNTPGVIWRGISHEEFDNIQKTGKIQSKGAYNLDGQEGLTYYSRDLSQAQSYAHGFAPLEHKATGKHHAYVIGVRDPGTHQHIEGTGENEVGIPHAIDKKDILHVYHGRAYASMPGNTSLHKSYRGVEEASSSAPTTSVAWRKMQ